MSELKRLIKKLCPDGVEYVKIGDIVDYEQPTKYIVENTDYSNNFDIPVLTAGQTFILGYTNEKNNIYPATKENPVIIFDDFTGAFKWVDFPFKVKSSAMKILTVSEDKTFIRYIFHIMGKIGLSSDEHKRLWISIYSEFKIPLPPIEVQREIVHILDNFTDYIDCLKKELELRKKQYEYYRDKLLTFGDDVEWKRLGEIATIVRGGNFQKKDFIKNGLPCIHYGQIYTHYGTYTTETLSFVSASTFNKSKIADKNDIVMAVTSENIKDVCKCVAWLGNENIAVSGHTAIIKHNQNAKFLSYYFQTQNFFTQKKKLAHGTKVIEVMPNDLNKIKIPVPLIEEQKRIVNILDKFDTLCNDLTSGIPAEINARQKQYEYYRNKLLQFN
ncbi:MAG: restriction endonuclease subunit S [Muribaculaceae bacterium]|nr:restriction endonuclease subunit S [Alistipes senegalensis]MCM1473453.1 restriction endonuclease subunit S [Muribaculaceae bacterium]